MKEKFLNNTIKFLKKYNNYSEKDLLKLRYGLEGLYLTFTKTIIVFIIAYILNIFKEVVIILLLFNIIRYFAFGFHAEKSYQCLIISIFNFILIPFLYIKLNVSLTTGLIIAGLCIVAYLLFAPADTVKRPLPNKKKRLIRKISTISIGCLYTIIMIIFNNKSVSSLILSSLTILVVVINPLTYWLFNQPYNNYKKIN